MITLYAKTSVVVPEQETANSFIIGVSLLGGGGVFTEKGKKNIIIDRINKRSINVTEQGRGDNSKPSWGVVSNRHEISFIDADGRIARYANMGLLKNGEEIQIIAKNTVTKKEQVVAVGFTENWRYNNVTRQVSVSVKDGLEDWQNIEVEGIIFDPRVSPKTGEFFYDYLRSKTPSKYNMVSFAQLDEETKARVSELKCPFPILYGGNLWQQWNKLCLACACYIHRSSEKTTFVYLGGS